MRFSYKELSEWSDMLDGVSDPCSIAHSIAESFYSKSVDPDIYEELCELALRISELTPRCSWSPYLFGESRKGAIRVGLAVLEQYDSSMPKTERFDDLFKAVEQMMRMIDPKKWETYWLRALAGLVRKHIELMDPASLTDFFGSSIDYSAGYLTGEYYVITPDSFEGAEDFNNGKLACFGPGLQALFLAFFPGGLINADDEWRRSEGNFQRLGLEFIRLYRAGVKIPTLQLDVMLVMQALERMAHMLEGCGDLQAQEQILVGMKALAGMTLNDPVGPIRLAEAFLRPPGKRRNWGSWMDNSYLLPMLTRIEYSLSRWGGLAEHPGNAALAKAVRIRIVMEALCCYRAFCKHKKAHGVELGVFVKAGPGVTNSEILTGLEEFIYRLGYAELGTLRVKTTTAALSDEGKLAFVDIFQEVEGLASEVLENFPGIRKKKFYEDLCL